MQSVEIDKLINKMGSVYKLVVLASLRAVEIGGGAAKLVKAAPDAKPTAIALQEIAEGKVSFKIKEEK